MDSDKPNEKRPDVNELAATRTDLALTRTRIAAERTLMAWIRTAISMISFGFSIFIFFQILQSGSVALRTHRFGARTFALTLVGLGASSLLLATIQHYVELKELGVPSRKIVLSLVFVFSLIIAFVGLLIFVGIWRNTDPFR